MTIIRDPRRIAGLCGVLFTFAVIAGVAIQGGEPVRDDSIDAVRADWIDEGQQYLLGDYVISLAFVLFFIPFVAALYGALRRAEGGDAVWSRICFIGALMVMAWAGWSSAFWGVLAFGSVANDASNETIQLLMDLDYYTSSGMPLTFVPFVGGASVLIARTDFIWGWIAIVGAIELPLAVLAPLSVLSTSTSSLFDILYEVAFLGFVAWILLVGISMMMRGGAGASTTPETAGPA